MYERYFFVIIFKICNILLIIIFYTKYKFFIGIIYSQNITLNVMVYSLYVSGYDYYQPLVDGFNEYSQEKNLGIYVHLTILTAENSTQEIGDYGSTVDSLLVKMSTKYDLYFFYAAYVKNMVNTF